MSGCELNKLGKELLPQTSLFIFTLILN